MPDPGMPTTPAGWIAAVIASMVGFLAGLLTLNMIARITGKRNGG